MSKTDPRIVLDLGLKAGQDCISAILRAADLVKPDIVAAETIHAVAIGLVIQAMGAALRIDKDNPRVPSSEELKAHEFSDTIRGAIIGIIVGIKGPQAMECALKESASFMDRLGTSLGKKWGLGG